MSRRHDQSFKLLFSLPLVVEQAIRRFINSDLADDLDFERMESLATERTAPGLIRSHADLLWKIHFRGSTRYLILLIEFQSEPDRYMPVRILYYIAIAYHSLVAAKVRPRKLAPGGMLPPALAMTIYNGRERWTAPDELLDLIEPARGWLASRQPRLRHDILDLRALAPQSQTGGSVMSWLASMELDSSAVNIRGWSGKSSPNTRGRSTRGFARRFGSGFSEQRKRGESRKRSWNESGHSGRREWSTWAWKN